MTSNIIRIQELEELIRYHSDKYFNNDAEITDMEFDTLVEELKQLEPTSQVLAEIGASPSYGKKIQHKIIMGSLEKITFEKDENGEVIGDGMKFLNKWYKEHPEGTRWSDKIDGAAMKLVYTNGKLNVGATRGDGTEGSDVIDNVRAIDSVPTSISSQKIGEMFGDDDKLNNLEVEIRGEFYIPRSFFEKNLRGTKANARNAVSGAVQNQDPSVTGKYGIKFRAYNIYLNGEEPETEDWKKELVEDIKGFHGINPVNFEFMELHDEKLTADMIEALDEKRKSYDFDTDGIVITINDKKQREKYGWNGKCPKGRVAFKYKPEQVETTVRDITWQPGRTGRLTPVAELKPVALAGSTISRCTLHNCAEIKRLDAAIGDKVLIQKGGDIIPQVVRVLERVEERNINYPEICPCCAQFTAMDENNVNVWCESPSCSSKLQTRLLHYLKALNIKEIGPAMIDTLIEANLLKDIDSLYYLDEDQIVKLPRCGLSSAQTVLNAIESVDTVKLSTFLHSLGIDNLGNTTSGIIAKKFKTLARVKILELVDLQGLAGIGDIIANSIITGLKANMSLIEKMEKILTIKDYEEIQGKLTGKNFFCTGALTIKRKVLQEMVEKKGGIYFSLKKGLDYLVVGEGAVQSKIDKAISVGAEVIDEAKFLEIVN